MPGEEATTPYLLPLADGASCRILVRAQPGARRSGVVGVWNGRLKIALRAPPQDGRANEELLGVLAAVLGLKRRDLQLVRGERAQQKEVLVAVPAAALRARLLLALQ